jgi:tRNA nucleotidyltransferase (CCA-adding enzyme)
LQLAEKAVVEQRIKNDKKQVLDFLSKEKLI